MMRIQDSVLAAACRSGVQQRAMMQKRAVLVELRKFNQQILAEIESTQNTLPLGEIDKLLGGGHRVAAACKPGNTTHVAMTLPQALQRTSFKVSGRRKDRSIDAEILVDRRKR
jgi:hypothetical protein